MESYRLRVTRSGKEEGFGTAWIAGPREVVTAFHVVGSIDAKAWLVDEADGFEYHLERGKDELVPLTPAIADPQSDLAILLAQADLDERPLALADAPAREGAAWSSEGYPTAIGDSFTLHGKVSSVKPARLEKALQLQVDHGTDISWGGFSGAPVRIDDRVVGVVNRQRARISTVWASSLEALRELLRLSVHHDDFVAGCQDLLVDLYDSLDDLRQLAKTLGWQQQRWQPEVSRREAARQLSQRGFREGATAFLELLRELQLDEVHVQDLDVGAFEKRFQRLVEPEEEPFVRPSRDRIVAEIIQLLNTDDCPGVALFQPLGFGGHRILDRVLEVLQEQDRGRLPVRLVPRRSLDEVRLYGTLLRGLRRGLERQTVRPLPDRWEAAFPTADRSPSEEDFELTLERLLGGPLEAEGRTLVLAMTELGRVERKHLQSWEHIFKRLIRAEGRPLQFLLLGGRELHDIYFQGALDQDVDSPWEDLERIELGPLLRREVEGLVKEQDGDPGWVDPLLEVTGGHPALVEELLERGQRELTSGDLDGLRAWVLASWLLQRLKKLVDQEPGLATVLQRFANGNLERREGNREERLFWLGLIKREGPLRWQWVTSVFADWVKSW